MVCFNLKFTYNFALLINMMLLMKKGILGCNIIYLFILICIGIALPIKSQNNYKVKLTGTVYEYDHNNKRLPLEFAAVSIPEIALGTTYFLFIISNPHSLKLCLGISTPRTTFHNFLYCFFRPNRKSCLHSFFYIH